LFIGSDDSLDDDGAIAFSTAFYCALASGKTFRQCFEIAKANVDAGFGASEAKKYVAHQK
jgi:hypothetical protein